MHVLAVQIAKQPADVSVSLGAKMQAYVANTKITFAHSKFISQIIQLRKWDNRMYS